MQQPRINPSNKFLEPTNQQIRLVNLKLKFLFFIFFVFGAICFNVSNNLFIKPFEQINGANLPEDKRIDQLEKARDNNIKLIGVLLTPLAPLATIGVAWLTIRNSQRITRDTLGVTQNGQIADRFVKAMDMLSSEFPPTQLAGIAILGKIGQELEEYRYSVIGILTAYIRAKCQKKVANAHVAFNEPAAVPEKLLTTMKFSAFPAEYSAAFHSLLSVRETVLDLKLPVLTQPLLFLNNLNFGLMQLNKSKALRISFVESDMRHASFINSDLSGSTFSYSDSRWTVFLGATLTDVDFTKADISHADFTGAKGLTWAQILEAKSSGGTRLPDDLFEDNAPGRPEGYYKVHYEMDGGWGEHRKNPPT